MKRQAITSRVRRALAAEEEADRRAGSTLRRLRRASRLSVARAASRADISPEEWMDHEAGTFPVPVTRLPRISTALRLDRDLLVRLLIETDAECPS